MWCEWLLGGRRAYIIQTYLCAQLSIYVHICIYRGVHMSMMIMMSMHMIHTHSNYHMHDSACMHALRICLYNVCTCMFIQSQCVDHVYIYMHVRVYTYSCQWKCLGRFYNIHNKSTSHHGVRAIVVWCCKRSIARPPVGILGLSASPSVRPPMRPSGSQTSRPLVSSIM